MQIHRCKASYWTAHGQPRCSYEVLYDGTKYRCNEVELDLLYKGVDPLNLDLVEIIDDDGNDTVDERAAHYLTRRP